MTDPTTTATTNGLAVVDWRDRIFALYEAIRSLHPDDPKASLELFRTSRDDLFRHHPASPIPVADRARFEGVSYFDYRHDLNLVGKIVLVDGQPAQEIQLGDDGTLRIRRIADTHFTYEGASWSLPLYWLEGYAGGIFVPFGDATNGEATYGAGRYLFDTRKGANLGLSDGEIVLDFNFAYNPSCAYDPRWTCPLAPPASILSIAIPAGERSPGATT